MHAGFWHERWEANQLGFHQETVNDRLREHWPTLGVARQATVFVPLCGKSLDMRWLRELGHPVVGVEVSPIAIRDFFAEAGIEPTTVTTGPFERSSGGGYELFCGDFFDLDAEALAGVAGVYDRASLIALPPETRARYAAHLAAILPEAVQILLITLEYDQARMSGPPHSVPDDEVRRLFGADFAIGPPARAPHEPAATAVAHGSCGEWPSARSSRPGARPTTAAT